MKKLFTVLFVAPAVSVIVLSLAVPVNQSSRISIQKGPVVLADGVPLPPPTPPPPPKSGTMIADGVPLPPPTPPPPPKSGSMVADGVPLPPPTPPPPPKSGMRAAGNLKALSV